MHTLRCGGSILVLAALAVAGAADDPPSARRTAIGGGASLAVPEGWRVQAVVGREMQALAGPAKHGVAAGFLAAAEPFGGPLEAFADRAIGALLRADPSARIESREAPTERPDGLRQIRVRAALTRPDGRQVRQVAYLIGGDDRTKYILIGTSAAEHAADLVPVFDALATSFRPEGR